MVEDTGSHNKSVSTLTEGKPLRSEAPRRRIDPYDLSSGDNPGSVISQPQLRGSNYDEWALNLRLALWARKKFGFADGSIAQPAEDSDDIEDWWANNAMVVSWIKLTVATDLSSSLSHHEIAHDLWTHIQKRFSMKNGQRVQRLKTELANCHQRRTAVEAYYWKLTKIWTSLADFQRAKTMEEIAKEHEEDKLHQFLMGLDETLFGALKSALLSRDPLPSLDEAYQVVAHDEESKRAIRVMEERIDGVSFAVHTMFHPRQQPKLRDPLAVCSACGRTEHLAKNCFQKIGYPFWWGDMSRSKLTPRNQGVSTVPQPDRRGVTTQVPNSRCEPAHANQVSVQLSVSVANVAVMDADRVGFTGLNDQQ